MTKGPFFFVFLLFSHILIGQVLHNNPAGLKKPKNIFGDKCQEYRELTGKLPPDVRFDVRVWDREIFIYFTSYDDFTKLFDDRNDALAVDVIHKDLYQCGQENPTFEEHANKGYLLPPLYKKDFDKKISIDLFKNVVIDYGRLPNQFNPNDIECNLIVLQKKAFCNYHEITNIELDSWQLLETGLYRDSVVNENSKGGYFTFTKELEFEIPFEKNKSHFSSTDIKPLYDSLRLTDYIIKEIYITAYTSVEGSVELNQELQKDRAQSIVDALQSFQTKKIAPHIHMEENWVQFANDISGTSFNYLRSFTKKQLRDSLLRNDALLKALEPVLAKQRKGRIRLILEKKVFQNETDPEKLKTYFESSIAANDLEQALLIQNVIFNKIKYEALPGTFLDKLEIPATSEYGPLFNNLVLFNWEARNYDLLKTISEFEKLESFLPGNSKIKYNILALKIKAWAEGPAKNINRQVLEEGIRDLEDRNIPSVLLNRIKINFNILLAQYFLYEKKFADKKRAINNILYYYRNLKLSDEDLYSLAKFLAFNSEFKSAVEVLEPRIKMEDVSEDIVFYYLKLAFSNRYVRPSANVDDLIEKAIEMNKQRFCNLFHTKARGGYTFQLKEEPMLKNYYCSSCE